jgi:tight adherence protein C
MSESMILTAGLVGIFAALLLGGLALGGGTTHRQQVARGLAAVDRLGMGAPESSPEESFSRRVLLPAASRLAALGRRLSPSGVTDKVQWRLDLAGNPGGLTVERVFAFKGIGLVGGALVGLLLGRSAAGRALALMLSGGAAGFYLPDLLLYNTGTKRQALLQRGLPDALDLLVISVQAGLGFDAALLQVARNADGPVAGEFFRVLQEMQIGSGRTAAFRALSERTSVAELRTFISALIQADALGIPVAAVLTEQAKEMRLKRQQRGEEKAQQVPVKILFPLVFFILPSLFVIIMGPAVISISSSFSGR